ncbi:MAG TPA: alpha/beta hydrolase [Longimicrobium sp.]|nr:alpha/beta hydrolase [Longimicrobium sp.]
MTIRRIRLTSIAFFLPLLASCASAGVRTGVVPREGFIASADGVRLYYRVAGSGPDTIVVINGGPGVGHEVLAPDVAPLEARHTVVFYDQRGGGRSGLPDTTMLGMDRFVEDLDAVRRHLGMERMSLLAHSYGPLIAASYARAHPERVERMIFFGGLGPRREDAIAFSRARTAQRDSAQERRWQDIARRMRAGTVAEVVDACRENTALMNELVAAEGWPVRRGTSCYAPAEAVLYGSRYTSRMLSRSLGEYDFTRDLAGLRAPILVITGDRDETPVPAHRSWAAAVPDGRLLLIPGGGHYPHIERPDVFYPAVDAFMADGWPADAVDPTP